MNFGLTEPPPSAIVALYQGLSGGSSGAFPMIKARAISRLGTLASIAALALFGSASVAWAQTCPSAPKPVPLRTMTIQIFNNSAKPIFPILSSSGPAVDDFLQAEFQVCPQSQLDARPYQQVYAYRIYVNPNSGGVAPGGSVTLKVPLFTQIVANQADGSPPDGKTPDQFADWWKGGRVSIGDSASVNQDDYKFDKANGGTVAPLYNTGVECPVGCSEAVQIFRGASQITDNEPTQLTEFTFGGINDGVVPHTIDDLWVDFDISYVDSAYLPVAMEPVGSPFTGWIGTILPVNGTEGSPGFKDKLQSFRTSTIGEGWPYFRYLPPATKPSTPAPLILPVPYKIPSPGTLFAAYSAPLKSDGTRNNPLTLTTPDAPPLRAMIKNWDACQAMASPSPGTVCAWAQEVNTLFMANYKQYASRWSTTWKCPGSPRALKDSTGKWVNNGEMWYLSKVYGWVPFNEAAPGCSKITNEIADTDGYYKTSGPPPIGPGYANAKLFQVVEDYKKMEYSTDGNPVTPANNPYVQLIHTDNGTFPFLGMLTAYGFSIDDASGNFNAPGRGLIIAVGGPGGLPNPNQNNPGLQFTVTPGYLGKGHGAFFNSWGYCQGSKGDTAAPPVCTLNQNLAPGGLFAVQPVRYPVWVTLGDSNGATYQFEVLKGPNPNSSPPYNFPQGTHANIGCGSDKTVSWYAWCSIVNTSYQPSLTPANGVSTPSPFNPSLQFAVNLGYYGPGKGPYFNSWSYCEGEKGNPASPPYCAFKQKLAPGAGFTMEPDRYPVWVKLGDSTGATYEFEVLKGPDPTAVPPYNFPPNSHADIGCGTDSTVSWYNWCKTVTTGYVSTNNPANSVNAQPPAKPAG